jgi:hypothetical protein
MNHTTKALTALTLFASSTAFAAGTGTQPATPGTTVQAAPTVPAPRTAPVRPQRAAPIAPAGQAPQVCRKMNGGRHKGGQIGSKQAQSNQAASPSTQVPSTQTPPTMKSAPVRPGAGQQGFANCGPVGHHKRGAGQSGSTGNQGKRGDQAAPGKAKPAVPNTTAPGIIAPKTTTPSQP